MAQCTNNTVSPYNFLLQTLDFYKLIFETYSPFSHLQPAQTGPRPTQLCTGHHGLK